MRVISGTARGTKLLSVPGDTTRPILDRVKTSLFDILRHRLPGTNWLDLFAGSGAVGIEALSQGAEHVTFIDAEPKAVATIKENLEKTRFSTQSEVRLTDAFLYLRKSEREFDIIYIAPPQYQSLWIEALQTVAERPHLVKNDGMIVIQIDPSEEVPFSLAQFEEVDRREYGKTLLMFLTKKV